MKIKQQGISAKAKSGKNTNTRKATGSLNSDVRSRARKSARGGAFLKITKGVAAKMGHIISNKNKGY